MTVNFGGELLAAALAGIEPGEDPLRHVADLPASPGQAGAWPDWAATTSSAPSPGAGSRGRGRISWPPPNWHTPGVMW